MTLDHLLSDPWWSITFLLVGVVGLGRFVRVVTYDEFPPSVWLRKKWTALVGEKWGKILTCFWCFSPYATAASMLWLAVGLLWAPWLSVAWFVVHLFSAISYLVSMLVARDEPAA